MYSVVIMSSLVLDDKEALVMLLPFPREYVGHLELDPMQLSMGPVKLPRHGGNRRQHAAIVAHASNIPKAADEFEDKPSEDFATYLSNQYHPLDKRLRYLQKCL